MNYLIFIGGLNAKESIRLCVREIFQDSLMSFYTWFGREENQRPLFNTRVVKAIYDTITRDTKVNNSTILYLFLFTDAVCENKYFEKPMRAAFQVLMRDTVRTAKQRHRNKMNNLRRPEGENQNERALWNDERGYTITRKLGQLYETKYSYT